MANLPAATVSIFGVSTLQDSGGTVLADGVLVRVGTFGAQTDTAIRSFFTADTATTLANLQSNFSVFGSGTLTGGQIFFDPTETVELNYDANPGSQTTFGNQDLYVMVFNNAAAGAATQVGLYRGIVDVNSGQRVYRFANDNTLGTDVEFSPVNLETFFGNFQAGGDGTYRLGAINQAYGITSALTATATRNNAFSYQITANNGPTSYSVFPPDALPAGLIVNATTGVISGTPTAAAGDYPFTIRATGASVTVQATLTLTLQNPAGGTPAITSSTAAQAATFGVAYAGYIITGSETPTSFGAAGLPTGLSLDAATGVISGTPTQTGAFTVTISATNASGTGSAQFTLTVAAPTLTFANKTFTLGTADTTAAPTPTAGFVPTTYTLQSGVLPAGLTLNAGTGLISGTPTETGTFPVTIRGTVGGVNTDGTITITVNTLLPTINSAAAFSATKGTSLAAGPGNYQITTVPSPSVAAPTSFVIVSGTLAPGLVLNSSTGVISGTPGTEGVFTVGLAANNGGAQGGGNGPTFNLTITVHNNFPQIHGGGRLSFRLNQSFTQLPYVDYNWLTSGAQGLYLSGTLPPGITNRTPEGSGFSGTPTVAGLFSSTITAFNMDFDGARLATSAPVQIRVNRGTQALYGMDGNLDGGAGGRALAGGVSGYLPDRFGRAHSSARVASASGLVHTNETTDVVDSFSLSLWFKMPETPVPPEGWYLLRGNPAVDAISLKLIPSGSGSGVRLQVENLSPRDDSSRVQGLFLDDHFTTPEIKGWEPGTGWHHLVFTAGGYYSRPMMYLDGVAIDGNSMVWQFSNINVQFCFDLNNFSIGGDPWNPTTAAAFPGEIDEVGLFDIPLLITDYSLLDEGSPVFWLQNRNPLGDPTVESLYLHGLQGQPGGNLSSFRSQVSNGGFHRSLVFKVKKIFDLEVGGYGVGGLDSNGRPVFMFPWPSFRDLTDDPEIWVPAPAIVSGLEELRFGVGFELGLKKGGQVVSRLWSSYGSSNQIIPHALEVHTAQGVAVAANYNTAMVLKNDGSLDVWHPVTVPSILHPEPSAQFLGQTNVPLGATNLVAVAAGSLHCLALSREGRVWAWGDNSAGQCDVPAAALQDVVKIAADGVLSMALTRQGRVVVWGIQEESIGSPDHFQGKYRFIDVGYTGSLGALTEDGRLVTWMRGSTEQLAHWTSLGLPQLLPEYAGIQGITRFKMGDFRIGDTGTDLPVILQASNVPSWKLQFPLKLVSPSGAAFARNLALEAELPSGQTYTFEAIGLPEGVTLDAESGLLSAPAGLPAQARTVTVIIRNPNGMDRRSLSLQGIQPGGIDLTSAHPQESLGPVLLARVFLPQGWQLNPLSPIAAYEAREASAGWEIWSRSGLDYENLAEQQVVVSVAATDPLGQIRTADLTVVLSDNPWEDADGDSIRQYYEEIYGSSDFSADTDGDGISDWQEIEAGSSPKNPQIKPGQASVAGDMTAANFRFRFHAPLGQWVKVQSSTNLVDWNEESTAEHPTELLFGFEGDGEMWEAEFPVSGQKRFYRTLRTPSRTLAR